MDFFLFSQDSLPQEFYFDGYCFLGSDYISGREGVIEYERENCRLIEFDEDGCYFLGRPTDGGFKFGADFQGNARIFLYRSEKRWALSNSFARLLDHIRANDLPFSVCSHQLDSWRIRAPFGQQPNSFKTAINEIVLVPSWCEVIVGGDGAKLNPRKDRNNGAIYQEAISNFVRVWANRIASLVDRSDISVTVDVSGGVDSRANLALLLAMRSKGFGNNVHFNSSKTGGVKGDFEVASKLAEKYHFSLNQPRLQTDLYLSTDTALRYTEDFLLGSYASLRPFRTKPNPFNVKIGGGAGEIFRPFFADRYSSDFLDSLKLAFSSDTAFQNWKADVLETLEILRARDMQQTDPLVLHYREFRSRFHTGGATNMITAAMPFQSRAAYQIAWSASNNKIQDGQIGYDLIGSVFPELLNDDYDNPSKKPTENNIRNLVAPVDFDVIPGKVYVSIDAGNVPSQESVAQFLKQYYKKFCTDLSSWPIVEKLTADEIVRSSLTSGRFPRPPEGASLHRMMLAAKIETLYASRRSNSVGFMWDVLV
ncbi:hypothetical protein [Paracoccus sp. TOH]|uniref:hypothetical protein n=1 Tax=Paracoccus sp. TOH TaxID=1263728 RepID=UPI0025B20CF2|nr:hypothetical protein [Paracoccus sp. TOH]WJS86325.1 hypothetical protein NBE95_13195 [Paracoccus sp. TOH]